MITFNAYEYYEYYDPHDMYNLDWTVVFLFSMSKDSFHCVVPLASCSLQTITNYHDNGRLAG